MTDSTIPEIVLEQETQLLLPDRTCTILAVGVVVLAGIAVLNSRTDLDPTVNTVFCTVRSHRQRIGEQEDQNNGGGIFHSEIISQ